MLRLCNSLDAAPFPEKELDAAAEDGGVARPRRRVPDRRLGGLVGADRRVPLWLVADRRPAPDAREPGATRRRGAADQMSWGPFIITSPTTITKAAATRRRPNGSPSSKVPIKAPNSTDVSRNAAIDALGPSTRAEMGIPKPT